MKRALVLAALVASPSVADAFCGFYLAGSGDKLFNEKVGMERAEAVKRYLYEQHQIPLHRMNVISYGEDKPMAPNNTKAGRAQNRRVVLRVLV